jgi:preprotein translocase subunit SecY
MWLGEQVTEFGIGNGISLIIFVGIISRIPSAVTSMISGVSTWNLLRDETFTSQLSEDILKVYKSAALHPVMIPVILIGALALVVFIVFTTNAERKIPVQYAKRVVGRKMYGGQSSHIPLKVNMSGVMPVIFAQTIATLPAAALIMAHEKVRDLFVKGKKKADSITAWIVPGSKEVERMDIEEGLRDILEEAGFELRQPGCSACLAMNEDKIPAGKYCVATSNRNFEGRQGPDARTMLAGPLVAAAAAVTGVITDPRELM